MCRQMNMPRGNPECVQQQIIVLVKLYSGRIDRHCQQLQLGIVSSLLPRPPWALGGVPCGTATVPSTSDPSGNRASLAPACCSDKAAAAAHADRYQQQD
jgi:hypothetical protein